MNESRTFKSAVILTLLLAGALLITACGPADTEVPPSPAVVGSTPTAKSVGTLEATAAPAEAVSLENTRWQLLSYFDGRGQTAAVQADGQITAEFTADGVSGSAGCNSYFASYQLDGDRLALGPIGATLMACNDPLGSQETAYLTALAAASRVRLAAGRLEALDAQGSVALTYRLADLTAEQLMNATFASEQEPSGQITLTGGRYQGQPVAEGSATRLEVGLVDPVALGDLDADGLGDAAVILATTLGGSGTFITLEAVLGQDGRPVHVATLPLGDRTQIRSVAIADGQILIEAVMHRPADPLCCPTQIVRKTLALAGNALVEVASEIVGLLTPESGAANATSIPTRLPGPPAAAGLFGRMWQWVGFEDTAGKGHVTPTAPSRYTLEFLADSTYQVVAPCGRSAGRFTIDGSLLTLHPEPTTPADCNSDQLYTLYLAYLADVATYVLEGGRLYLNLVMDGGNLVFAAQSDTAGLPGQGPTKGVSQDIVDRRWRWVRTTTPVGDVTVSRPEHYTIQFMPTGDFYVLADCNRASGRYTLEGNLIRLELTVVTRAECGPDSLGDDFLRDLGAAVIAFLEGGDLYLDLLYDSGTMRFSK